MKVFLDSKQNSFHRLHQYIASGLWKNSAGLLSNEVIVTKAGCNIPHMLCKTKACDAAVGSSSWHLFYQKTALLDRLVGVLDFPRNCP